MRAKTRGSEKHRWRWEEKLGGKEGAREEGPGRLWMG